MSNIVFIEMPAYGHVNPTLPVVQELVRRGEHVVYYYSAEFQTPIEAAGALFRPYPAGTLTSADIARATQSGDITRVPAAILRASELLVPFMLDELRGLEADVVVLDANALWGHLAARMLKLPTVSLMTTFMISQSQLRQVTLREWIHLLMPVIPNIPGMSSARSRAVRSFGTAAFPERPVFPARGDLNIAFIPREFQPDNPLVDDTFRFVGPTINSEAHLGAMPYGALDSQPIIYISLGTLHKGDADFFRQCFEAFADMPTQFIVSTGTQTETFGTIPSNFTIQPFVPQLDVLQHASALGAAHVPLVDLPNERLATSPLSRFKHPLRQ